MRIARFAKGDGSLTGSAERLRASGEDRGTIRAPVRGGSRRGPADRAPVPAGRGEAARPPCCRARSWPRPELRVARPGDERRAAGQGSEPVLFLKPSTSVTGPGDAIKYPVKLAERVDFEGELAVIIGRALPGRAPGAGRGGDLRLHLRQRRHRAGLAGPGSPVDRRRSWTRVPARLGHGVGKRDQPSNLKLVAAVERGGPPAGPDLRLLVGRARADRLRRAR